MTDSNSLSIRKALLVEDNPRVLATTQAMLAQISWQSEGVRTVAEARQAFTNGTTFSALICDVTLSDGKGFDLIPDFRELFPEGPVLVISGGDFDVSGLGEKVYFLQKPFGMSELSSILNVEGAEGLG